MTHPTPWIALHAVWTSRARSGLAVHEQIARFVDAVAVDPAPRQARVTVHEDLGPQLARLTREVEGTPAAEAAALVAIGYRPGPLVEAVTARLGPGLHRRWASGASGFLFHWTWTYAAGVIDLPALLALAGAHEGLPRVGPFAALAVDVEHDFALARPGTREPCYPASRLRSSAHVDSGSKHASVMVRYDQGVDDAAFRALHRHVLGALGDKPPRHVLQRILPPHRPGGRERREPLP